MNKYFPAIVPVTLSMLIIIPSAYSAQFRFKHKKNEKYRVITEVKERVYHNTRLSHRSHILNKVSVHVKNTTKDDATLYCIFQTSEGFYRSLPAAAFVLKRNYTARFKRNWLGKYTIDKKYFMPVIRDVPLFPAGNLKPGDTWTMDASEAHDLRRGYRIATPLIFPIKVNFTYVKNKIINGKKFAVIRAHYVVFHTVHQRYFVPGALRLTKITGTSDKTFLWDFEAGNMDSFKETFDFIFHLSQRGFIEYKGVASGRRIKSPGMNKRKIATILKAKLKKLGIEGSVKIGDKGVTLVLNNIYFKPYSSRLPGSEKIKLNHIGKLLKHFANRDILITGHTARSGSERSSQVLSEKRAHAVGRYLLQKKAVKRSQLVIRGLGSQKPVAPNNSEKNMKKNRRVEITILEN